MMRVTLVALALCASAVTALTAQAPAGRDPRFVGHWRLVSFMNIDDQGVATPNRLAGGRIMYDAAGHMSAQLTQADRPALPASPTEAQRAAAYAGYVAYYGAYEIDAAARKVTHHVEGSTNPNWLKTALVRYFEFAADGTLKLSIRNEAGRTTGTLTWARIP